MKVFIYDHQTKREQEGYYHASCNYWDSKRSGNKNYAYIDSFPAKSDYFLQATDDLSEFSDCKVHGKTIKELISFEGISLWWFYEIAMRINYMKYLGHLERLDGFFGKKEVSSVLCDINDSIFMSALKDICRERGINIEVAARRSLPLSSARRYAEYIQVGLNFLADLVISRIYDTKRESQLIIASYTSYWTRYNVIKESQKDGIFDSIQRKFEEYNLDYIGIEYNTESMLNYAKTRWNKQKCDPGKWIPLNAYTSWKTILQSAKIFNMVNRQLSGAAFDNNKDNLILKMLKNHISTSFFLISEILSFINALSLIRPKAIITSCEYCKMGRAAMAAGNRENLPTIALQHGIITSKHEGYIFSKSEKSSFDDAVNSRPMPRYTLLYGPADREILINNSNYPESSLIITGQPRYDYLYEISQAFDGDNKFLEEINLNHPLIVWTSQPGHSDMENKKTINCVLNLLNVMQVNLFIKPHPIETDLSVYNSLTQRKNVVLSKDVNIYKLLNACDLMITKNSTTAMEAAALNKPVIVLNLSGEPDLIDYVKEGIALGVYEEKDLPVAVKRLLENDLLKGQRQDYVEKHLYKIDGKSSERAANFIKNLINRQ